MIKDAMIMIEVDTDEPEWPMIPCSSGEYVMEINVPEPFYAHRVRVRKEGSNPILGNELGNVSVDHAFVAIIDYESFLDTVKKDIDSYEEWTMTELDDELAINFSGEILFNGEKLLYVKSGEGDGIYPTYELIENDIIVGLETIFIADE